jgi:hypothetical protein
MVRLLVRLMLAGVVSLVGVSLAHADSIGPKCSTNGGGNTSTDSGNCGGDVYTLTYGTTPVSSTSTTNTFAVTLDDNTAGFMGSKGQGYVLAVALQLNLNGGGTVDSTEATLVSAPGGTGDWTQMAGGTSSAGCDGHGNFFCEMLNIAGLGSSAPDKTGGTYDWTFDVTISNTKSLDASSFGDELKAVYFTADSNNQFDGVQTSAAITLQPGVPAAPEPSALLLLSTGLCGLPLLRRRARA